MTAVSPRGLAAALRGAGVAEVDESARRRAEYSSDASNYRVLPSVVAFPRHVEEAAAALRVATQFGVPVTSRGGGTSTAGNSVGRGIVLDFSRHMNRVLSVDAEARTAVAEPGAVLDDITAAAAAVFAFGAVMVTLTDAISRLPTAPGPGRGLLDGPANRSLR